MRYKLSEIFDLQMGKTPDRHNPAFWEDGSESWISIADLGKCDKYIEQTAEYISEEAVDKSGIKVIPKDTVIMSFKLSIGKVAITPKEMYSNEAIMAFINKGLLEINPAYLYYLLMHRDWDAGTNKAVMGKTLNKATLSQIEVDIHSSEEQCEIVQVLDKVSDIIKVRKQQLAGLDNLIKARFVELFGDPVVNPFQWSTRPLLEMGYCKNGMNFHTGDSGIEMHCLGVGDFKDYAIIDGTDRLPTISLNELPPEESMLRDGDIVFVRSNGNKALVGRCVVVYPRNTPTTYSGFCIRYRLTSNEVNTAYLLRVLKTDSMRKKMAGRGANIQNLNQQILATLNIPLPPMDLQKQFAVFVEQVDKSKVVVQNYIKQTIAKRIFLDRSGCHV